MKGTVSHEQATIESFQRDPVFAKESLRFAIQDGDQENLLTTLRYVITAFGSVKAVAKAAGINEKSAYRSLSGAGNPTLHTLRAVMAAVGLKLSVEGTPRRVMEVAARAKSRAAKRRKTEARRSAARHAA